MNLDETPIWRQKQVWAGLLVSLICFAFLFLYVDVKEVWHALTLADYRYVFGSAIFIILFMIIRAIRWHLLLGGAVPLRSVFHIQNVGYMLTNILPLRIGDIARALLIGNVPPITVGQGISTMVVERVLDLLFMVTLFPLAVASLPDLPPWLRATAQSMALLAFSAAIILVIAANQRERALSWIAKLLALLPISGPAVWLQQIDNLLRGLHTLTQFRAAIWLLTLSILVWIPILIAYHLSLLAFGMEPTPLITAFVVCVAAFSIAAPSAPGGAGVFHGAVATAIWTVLGWPETIAVSFAFLYHALTLLMMVLLGSYSMTQIGTPFSQILTRTRNFIRQQN